MGGVIYQVYPRSFADSNGDGVGDIRGLASKLDHLAWLGVNTIWSSPTFPSPNVDWGYDVSDYHDVHPELGTLADLDALIAGARERDIDVWLDLVPNHTSDKHPWFTDRPDYYVWAREIPNNWTSMLTGGPAWQYDAQRREYYLHLFAPQQPDLDWWNPDVRDEFDRILRFWFDRGVRGLRIDVAHGIVKDRELRDNRPHADGDPWWVERLGHWNDRSMNQPEVHDVYRRWRAIAHEYDPPPTLMGETYVGHDRLFAYLEHLDLVQDFELVNAPFEIDALRPIVEDAIEKIPAGRSPVWFGSNHDHSRLATRWAYGDEARARAALFLLLTLPGSAILYQGDEIALEDGKVPPDRMLDLAVPPRDAERTPLPWTRSGEEWHDPWLPLGSTKRNIEDQRADPDSTLHYVRDLIARRKAFSDESYETLPSATGIWAYRRGDKTCVLNMTDDVAGHEGNTLQPWQGLIV